MRVYKSAICNGCNTELVYHADIDAWLHTELTLEDAWTHPAVPDMSTVRNRIRDEAVQIQVEEE